MNILDTSYLSIFLNTNPPTPKDRSGNPVPFFKERVEALIAELNGSDNIIGVPAPVLAEVLVKAGKNRALFVNILNDRYKFEILPFGARAAVEAAELIDKIKAESKAKQTDTWAKVKFDTQIVAIAKAESADVIYSDDIGLERSAKRVGIRVLRICDLPYVPPATAKVVPISQVPGTQMTLLETPESYDQQVLQAAQGEPEEGSESEAKIPEPHEVDVPQEMDGNAGPDTASNEPGENMQHNGDSSPTTEQVGIDGPPNEPMGQRS